MKDEETHWCLVTVRKVKSGVANVAELKGQFLPVLWNTRGRYLNPSQYDELVTHWCHSVDKKFQLLEDNSLCIFERFLLMNALTCLLKYNWSSKLMPRWLYKAIIYGPWTELLEDVNIDLIWAKPLFMRFYETSAMHICKATKLVRSKGLMELCVTM